MRTLHDYDEIGLLCPSGTSAGDHCLYDAYGLVENQRGDAGALPRPSPLHGGGARFALRAALVGQWQALITRYFYDCSDEMLSGLGGMYVADERFTWQTDRSLEGLAAFLRDAIRVSCGRAEG